MQDEPHAEDLEEEVPGEYCTMEASNSEGSSAKAATQAEDGYSLFKRSASTKSGSLRLNSRAAKESSSRCSPRKPRSSGAEGEETVPPDN